MKTLALTAALGAAALLAGCNQKATTASPGAIDTQGCCASKSSCAVKSTACSTKKAAACPMSASAKTNASACCSSKKK
ncbi:MAG: hypothetical protein P8I91_01165 [Phycisphaerales bacterium]|nr:hypothetical protein [Phycisphaerales bacterium]